jgi:uncharacterized protein (TIGR00730 family)
VAAICVFCASSRTLAPQWLELASTVGAEIARRGHVLVSGGGRVGMMGAVAAGARTAGGYTYGVMPQSLVDREIADTASDELVVTDGMASRKNLMIEKADAFLVLPGGLGTLDELFEVWTTAMLGAHEKPVVVLDAGGFYGGLMAWVRGLAPSFVRPAALDLLVVVDSTPAALDAIEARVGVGS